MRVIATEIRYREPARPWLTSQEYEERCCEPGDAVPCQEVIEDFLGFTEQEILDRLGIKLKDGRDEQGRIVEIRWKNIPKDGRCGQRITRHRLPARTCCADVTPVVWDADVSAEVVAPGSSCVVAVTGGRGPYTWEVAGHGFWLDPGHAMTTGETNDVATYLYADATACGAAAITVTDICGNQAAGHVRSTVGQWVKIGVRCQTAGCPNPISYYPYDQIAELIDGDKKYYLGLSSTCGCSTFNEAALECWPRLFAAGELQDVHWIWDPPDTTHPLVCQWTLNSWSLPCCEGDKCRVCVAMREDYQWTC